MIGSSSTRRHKTWKVQVFHEIAERNMNQLNQLNPTVQRNCFRLSSSRENLAEVSSLAVEGYGKYIILLMGRIRGQALLQPRAKDRYLTNKDTEKVNVHRAASFDYASHFRGTDLYMAKSPSD